MIHPVPHAVGDSPLTLEGSFPLPLPLFGERGLIGVRPRRKWENTVHLSYKSPLSPVEENSSLKLLCRTQILVSTLFG